MTVLIAAGGTGGHLYPAVALAHEFRRRDPNAVVRFVGTERGLERTVLPREGFPLDLIVARPLMGLGFRQRLQALLALPIGIKQCMGLLRRWRTNLVVGIGGYTSPSLIVAAALLRIPRVILEPNAYPGMANRMLGPFADRVFLAFPEAAQGFRPGKVRVVGTPLRRLFLQAQGEEHREHGRRLLIVGGSQGAKAINSAVLDALPSLARLPGLTVTHQTGANDYARVKAAYDQQGLGEKAQVHPFLFDMPEILQASDLVVCRAGAVTLAELSACGKAAVLIPLPHAIYNHQARNAEILEKAGAAVVLHQEGLTGARLAETVTDLFMNPDRLRCMEQDSRSFARTDAAERMTDECLTLIK